MGLNWFLAHWFDLIETVGVVGGLWFTAVSLHSETKTRRIANLLTITANHREIWKEFLNNPKLARVCDATADIRKHPVTDAERIFTTLVILQMNTAYYAMSDQLVVEYEGLRRDVAQFFSRPVPKAVWEKIKQFQNDDFVKFIESVLK
jgi:ligand-binding SRPBCC domain-containing protein